MKLDYFWSLTASLLVAVLLDVSGPGLGSAILVCESGYYRSKPTDDCRPCTVCSNHMVETAACRHTADTVCAVRRSCPSDAFYNKATGLCQRCTRLCSYPLVKMSPCLENADAVCGPRSTQGGSKGSRRRGSAGKSRRKKRRHKKRQRMKPGAVPNSRPEKVAICREGRFYDQRRGKCVPCSAPCDFLEVTPCTENNDRVCFRETTTPFDHFDSIRFNELPDAAESKQQTSVLSNEYPGSPKDRRIDSEYQASESLDNYPKNHEASEKSDSSRMVLSNSPETVD